MQRCSQQHPLQFGMRQGMEVFQATQLGANIHGAIGDFFSETNYSVNAQRLVDEIPYFMKKYLK